MYIIAVILVILCLALMFLDLYLLIFLLSTVNSGALLLERLGSHGLVRGTPMMVIIIIIIIIIVIVKLTHRCINPITSQLKKISY
jgi:hypothetical protein